MPKFENPTHTFGKNAKLNSGNELLLSKNSVDQHNDSEGDVKKGDAQLVSKFKPVTNFEENQYTSFAMYSKMTGDNFQRRRS